MSERFLFNFLTRYEIGYQIIIRIFKKFTRAYKYVCMCIRQKIEKGFENWFWSDLATTWGRVCNFTQSLIFNKPSIRHILNVDLAITPLCPHSKSLPPLLCPLIFFPVFAHTHTRAHISYPLYKGEFSGFAKTFG